MTKTAAEIIAERLQDRLDAAHPTRRGQQTWLARRVDMKPQGIQSILAGSVERPKKIKEMAEVLETSQAYLLGETDDPAPENAAATDIDDEASIIALLERIRFIGPGNGRKAMRLLRTIFSEDDDRQQESHLREQSRLSSRRHESEPS